MPVLFRLIPALFGATAMLVMASPAQAEVLWLCEPGLAENPCELPMDTTVREFGLADRLETPPIDPSPNVDCFYVYPTVSNEVTLSASKARAPEIASIAKYQAARFSRHCRMFAPIYRQGTLLGLATQQRPPAVFERAYADVSEAWREYLAEHNEGRGVVLIGHSQGTRMLRVLIRREIDPKRRLRRLLVSGLLIGANVTVAEGGDRGGDFRRVPLCTEKAQLGCVVAFSTYAEDPPADSRFGRSLPPAEGDPSGLPGGSGYEIACTDPRRLAGYERPLRVLVPSEPFAPGPIAVGIALMSGGLPPSAPTTWVTAPDRYEGGCEEINGSNVLRLQPIGESRTPPPFPDDTWGTHLLDVNIALDPLVGLVGRQIRKYERLQQRGVNRTTP